MHMTMRLEPLFDRDRMILRMPLWRPGSYRYSNYQRKISELTVVDQDGIARPLQRLDDRSWQFRAKGATSIRVDYDLEVRNDADSGAPPAFFVHGPATFLTVDGTELLPHFLRTLLPENWDFASGHRPYPGGDSADGQTWYSPNFDVFVDCPMAFGAMERYNFELKDKPFEIVLLGKLPSEEEFNRELWVAKVRKISAAAFDVVGDFPFERYVYLYIFNDIGGYSGLEHLNSTTIEVSHRMVKRGRVEPLESVTAHEFFHLWNVKRIRPAVLGPFDYSKDAHTDDLWWMEGVTSYYNDVILQRSGLRDGQDGWFLGSQLQNRGNLMNAQGYGRVSPEQASWRVWSSNSNVSYYDLGQSLGWLIDIQIRHHSHNQRSLDDVVRALNRWVDYPGTGLNDGDIERMIKAVSGWDCSEFFDLYVSGNNAFPFAEVLPLSGLKVTQARAGAPYLGIRLDDDITIASATNDFQSGDKLVSIDGTAIPNLSALRELIPQLQPGSDITLVMENGGEQRTISWTVKERDSHAFRVQPMAEMNELQRAIFDGIHNGTPKGV